MDQTGSELKSESLLADGAETLKDSQGKFKAVFNFPRVGFLIIDPETHLIADMNHFASEMIGLPKDRIVGRVCQNFLCPAEKGRCPVLDLGEKIENARGELVRADGKRIPVIKVVNPIVLGDRRFLLESFIDSTDKETVFAEKNRREEELKRFALEAQFTAEI